MRRFWALAVHSIACFNPRTRVGCDIVNDVPDMKIMFQSTHPCGVRRADAAFHHQANRFNPRTRVGCDDRANDEAQRWLVSIHAPVWGATYY